MYPKTLWKLCLRFIRKCVYTLSNSIKLYKIWYLDEFGFWFVRSVPEDDKDLRSPWSFMNLTMTSNIVRNGSGSSCIKRQNFVNDSEDRHTIHPNICLSFTSIDTENHTQQNQWHFHNINANVAWYNVDGSFSYPEISFAFTTILHKENQKKLNKKEAFTVGLLIYRCTVSKWQIT